MDGGSFPGNLAIGVRGGGLISPALPRPAPPKGWSLQAGLFFPTSNWKNWPLSLARGQEGEQGGIEPGGASQWPLCPRGPGAGPFPLGTIVKRQ